MRRASSQRLFDHFDWPLLGITVAIVLLGLLNLYSATYGLAVSKYFDRQLLWALVGFVIAIGLTFFDYRLLERLAYPIYLMMLFLLLLVLLRGKTALGAQRWLQLGFFSLQPSELAKPVMALVLAKYLHGRGGRSLDFSSILRPALLTAIPVLLILKQPDLGTALIVVAIAGVMLLFTGVSRKLLVVLLILSVLSAPLIWKFGLKPYQKNRIHIFLNPEEDLQGKGYQIVQSKAAVGSGELTGKGFLKGTQSKLQFLPKQHTDFVFSNFAEEWGFLGSVTVLILYAIFCLLGLNVANSAKERFGLMLALGLTALVSTQALINLGMEVGLLPVVGVPLPFFSYGGTSLLTNLMSVGLLLNISMRRYLF